MILPRRLIDNYYIYMDSWMPNMLQHTESFERKIYNVLATTDWWPKVSKTDRQTFDVFCDAYYIVTLCLMRNGQRPENWCDDFFDIMGQERNKKGEYIFIEERQWAVMSIVLCVFKHMNEVGLQNLMYRIENRLKRGKGYEVLERMLDSTKEGKYRQNKKKYAPQDLSHGLRFDRINWYDYIDVFDSATGEYIPGDLPCLLATLGSGRTEENVEYPVHLDDYNKARGKLERLCIADALEDFFKHDESQQKKGANLEGPAKDFEGLWKNFEWYRGDLLDWLTGRPRWECDEDVYCNPEAYDEKYADEIVYPLPKWIDDADNWPALTIESFVYFLDVLSSPLDKEDKTKNSSNKDFVIEETVNEQIDYHYVPKCFKSKICEALRERVKMLVDNYYHNKGANLFLIMAALYKYECLKESDACELFVLALVEWGILPDSAKEMRINETGKTSIILANRMSRKKSDIQKKSPSVISIDYKGWPDGKAKTLCDKMYRALLEKDDRQIEL